MHSVLSLALHGGEGARILPHLSGIMVKYLICHVTNSHHY